MSAGYYAQFELNHGTPVASSIPATEHSVMTAWDTEQEAMETMLDRFGDGTFATVMDSYDYSRALNEVSRGGYWHLIFAVCRHSHVSVPPDLTSLD